MSAAQPKLRWGAQRCPPRAGSSVAGQAHCHGAPSKGQRNWTPPDRPAQHRGQNAPNWPRHAKKHPARQG
eukprot:15478453-Alexandrium_andersonii.AAC.1